MKIKSKVLSVLISVISTVTLIMIISEFVYQLNNMESYIIILLIIENLLFGIILNREINK